MRLWSANYAARPQLGCTGPASAVVACMRARPVEQLLNAFVPDGGGSLAANVEILPNVDGRYVPVSPGRPS